MRTTAELKAVLQQVAELDYALPAGIDLDGLIADMLHHMGDTDSKLRDDLIFGTLASWEDGEVVSPDQMRQILRSVIDEKHLLLSLGENGTDTVFMRAFAALAINCAICYEMEKPYMTDDDKRATIAAILRHVDGERDYRGYVEGKGWAHAIAHAADVLWVSDAIATADEMPQILGAIKTAMTCKHATFSAGEDDRMATAFVSLFYESALENEIVKPKLFYDWIADFVAETDELPAPEKFNLRFNRRNFIKSLYANLVRAADDYEKYPEDYRGICEIALAALNKIYE